MKKIVFVVFGVLILLLGAVLAIPVLFKDKILARIQQEINQSLQAKVYFDPDQISLSLFRHFPKVSAGLGGFGVVGIDQFEKDTLIHGERLDLAFNLKSVLFDEYPTLSGLYFEGGDLYIKVLEDGSANYDIVKPSEASSEESSSQFKIEIEEIQVSGLNLIYDDRSLQFVMAMGDIEAKGSGAFTQNVYDLPLQLTSTIADLNYEGTHYLSNKQFKGETLLQVDMEQMKFSFQKGSFSLNDFLFDLSGFVALPEDGIDFDLNFKSPQTDFKQLLSLVPGMYQEDFSKIKTEGLMAFEGFVRGKYSDSEFPAFDIKLEVNDGKFQYPDLPMPVSDINLKFQAINPSADLENTRIELPVFSLNVGSNPISGKLTVENLKDYPLDGNLNGKLNLKELTSVFPIQGTQISGVLDLQASAKGRYDQEKNILPVIQANFSLVDGFVKNAEYPIPLEKIQANAKVLSTKGTLDDFLLELSSFGFELEGERISGNLTLKDFEKLNWQGTVSGGVDLEKLTAIFPVEGTTLSGKIQADLSSTGSFADVEANRYEKIQASGTMGIRDLTYRSVEYPQGVKIERAQLDFNPQRANLTEFKSQLGKSPLVANGYFSGYMDYLLSESGILKGQLSLSSSKFDVNEWMSDSSTPTEEGQLEVVSLPENLDFTMSLSADEVLYDNLNLKEVKGTIVLRDGVLQFSDAGMKALDGRIRMKGSYDPRNLTAPAFDFNLDISELSIAKAFQSLTTVQAFAPIAKDLTGLVNTNINFSGLLGPDMMPVLPSLDIKGILKVTEAALRNSAILQGVTSLTGLKDANTLTMKNLSIPVSIENGRMEIRPFDLKLWDYQTTIQGSAGFDGSMNYLLNMMVPAGKFGAQANTLLATISGTQASESTLIPLSLNLSGTYNQPKIALAGGNSIETLLTNALRSRLDSEKQNLQEKATQEFQAVQDSLKQELKLKADLVQDSLKKELEKKGAQTKDKAVEEAKTMLKGLLVKPKPKPDTTRVNNN
ncbi:MAG: AsmA-like C-terminal region-containing protein [Algoriphagus aquaeductus]|uniref:AsmA-like C-terminal region-containing protein n=1 Tax=Algoriphagus aquaeductus TaxID=475299 RepID=UPI003919F2D8